ncbi:MAG: beta-lactamase family protein [Blastocatellia bacterium]|nr:beta-lactamase family protein [Blastocatellia bacterium]
MGAPFPTAAQSTDRAAALDRYLARQTELGRFSGAVLIAEKGRILFRRGYGFADVEAKIPYTPETRHAVASLTKMVTSAAALKLRDQGKLKLEDSICTYLAECPETWKPVTIQHLMRHTSGIPDYEEKLDIGSDAYLEFMKQPGATAKIMADARKLPLDFKPGEKFNYSNTGYILLSLVVEKAAGKPFVEYVTETLLKPAGMTQSGFFGAGRIPKNLANGYTHKLGDKDWGQLLEGFSLTAGHLKKLPQLALTPPAGDAGLYTTVDDLYRWSQVMDGGKVISAAEVAEIFTPGLDGYGYGWFVGKGFNRKRMRHDGFLPGYISDFVKFPDDQTTIIAVSNLERVRLRTVMRDLTAIVFGAPYDMPVQGKMVQLTEAQTGQLLGEYQTTQGKLLVVGQDPDYLTAEIKDQFKAGLIPLSPTEFYFPLGDGKVTFTLDGAGRAVKVNLRYGGEDHLAERKEPSKP